MGVGSIAHGTIQQKIFDDVNTLTAVVAAPASPVVPVIAPADTSARRLAALGGRAALRFALGVLRLALAVVRRVPPGRAGIGPGTRSS